MSIENLRNPRLTLVYYDHTVELIFSSIDGVNEIINISDPIQEYMNKQPKTILYDLYFAGEIEREEVNKILKLLTTNREMAEAIINEKKYGIEKDL